MVVLVETWVEEIGWDRIRSRMPKGYKCTKQWAKKKNSKVSAMGGLMVGVREEMAG